MRVPPAQHSHVPPLRNSLPGSLPRSQTRRHEKNSPRTAAPHALPRNPSSPPACSSAAGCRTIRAEFPSPPIRGSPPRSLLCYSSLPVHPSLQPRWLPFPWARPDHESRPPLLHNEFRLATRSIPPVASPSPGPRRTPSCHSCKASTPTDTPTPTCIPSPDTTTMRRP
jgi:hypothetical protein